MNTKIERERDQWRIMVDSDNQVTSGWTGNGWSLTSAKEGYQLLDFAKALTRAAEDICGYEWVNDQLNKDK